MQIHRFHSLLLLSIVALFSGVHHLRAQIPTIKGYSETKSGMLYYDFKATDDQKERLYRYTICPDSSGCISLDFNWIDSEEGIDFIKVFGGKTNQAPLVTTLGGKSKSLFVQSASTCLTIEFTRDKKALKSIWTATWNGRTTSECIKPLEDNPCADVHDICGPSYHENFHYYGKNKANSIESLQTACLSQPHNPSWYRFVVQKAGKLSFTITPDNGFDDFDWILLREPKKKTQDCPENGPNTVKLACNYAIGRGPGGATGMGEWGDALSSGSSENPFCTAIDAQQGEVFFLLVDDFSKHSSGFTIRFNDLVMACENPKKDLLQIDWKKGLGKAPIDPRKTFSQFTKVVRIDLSEKVNLPISLNQLPTSIFDGKGEKVIKGKMQLDQQTGIVSALLTGLKTTRLKAYQPNDFVTPLHYGDLLLLAERQMETDSASQRSWWNPSSATMGNFEQVVELIVDEIFDKNTGRKRQKIRYIRLLWTDRDDIAPDFYAAVFKYEEVWELLDQIPVENRHTDVQSLSIRDFLEGQRYRGTLVSRSHKQINNLQQAKFSGDQQIELENYIWE